MITFILLGAGFIVLLALVALAWGANNRKRAGQAETPSEKRGSAEPTQGRATPPTN